MIPLANNALPANSLASEKYSVVPTGNSITSLSSFSLAANAASASEREFMVNLGFVSDTGGSTAGADKVTLYSGVIGHPGSGNVWASNFLVQSTAGFTGDATAGEFDANNSGADAPPYTSRIVQALGADGTISGPNNYMTAGVGVGSVAQTNIFHYGYMVVNNAAHDAAYMDSGDSAISYLNSGSHMTAVLDDTGASPVFIDAAGSYGIAAITTQYANTGTALFTANGQKVCLAAPGGCFYYKKSTEAWIFLNSGGTPIMSLNYAGNIVITGTITQNGTVAP